MNASPFKQDRKGVGYTPFGNPATRVRPWTRLPPAAGRGGRKGTAVRNLISDRLGRPKKSPLEVRRNKTIRLSLIEEAKIAERATRCGMDLGEFIREAALDHEIAATAARSADPRLVNKLDGLGQQVAALGNLVNQVALYLHTDRRLPADWETLPGEIDRLKSQVAATLDEVILGS